MAAGLSELVLIGVASIPEREHTLRRVLTSLAPQADRVHVALNDYDHTPRWLSHFPNVTSELTGPDNLGDAEKFRAVADHDGIVLTCDDDIRYPAGYIAETVAALDRWPGRAVSHHGGTTYGWNGSDVAASHKRIRCLHDQPEDDPDVNVLGTGTLAYRTRDVAVWPEVFRTPNMADVWFALHGQQLGIGMVGARHRAKWLRDICPPVGDGRRIYDANRNRDGSKCDTTEWRERVARSSEWVVDPPRPRVHVSVATCRRPELLLELLGDLEREAQWVDLSVTVFQDGPGGDYTAARELCEGHGWEWRSFALNQGRRFHYRLVNTEFQAAKGTDADWFLFMPDDVRLKRHAIPKGIVTWHRLEDPATLTLWRLQSLEGLSNWTGEKPVQRDGATEIFHVDGFHLCRRATLELLDWQVGKVRTQYTTGSGVGSKISKRLHFAGARMYRVDESLAVSNDGGVSVMNGDERELHPAVAL